MPPVAAAVAATAVGVAGAGGLAGFTFLGVSGIGGALLATASSLALGALSSALTPKPSLGDTSSFASIRSQGITRQLRQAVTERRIVYGETRVSGPIVFFGSTNDNEYLHMVIALAAHEVEEIGEIFVNEESITPDMIDGSGNVIDGKYDGLIRIKKHLGTQDQAADSDLVSEIAEWTTDHRLRGIAYIYARLKFDRDVFPSGIPNFSAWLKGKKIFDGRDDTVRYSSNLALFTRDYLTDSNFGMGAPELRIDNTTFDASANTCDEIVDTTEITVTLNDADSTLNTLSLAGDLIQFQTGDRVRLSGGSLPSGLSSGTDYYVIAYQRKDNVRIKLASNLADAIAGNAISISSSGSGSVIKTGEPRYHGGGVIKTSAERGANIEEILSGMAGKYYYSGGKHRLLVGEYQIPTVEFGVDDLAGPISTQTKVSKRDRFNRVQGVYISPLNQGNPTDFPPVENSTYQTQDLGVIKRDINLPFTQRPHTAQRIAKIELERSRQEIIFNARFKITAFKVKRGDNFYFNFPRYGWSNKVFEVIEWTLTEEANEDGIPILFVDMVCRENDASVYDWNSGEETSVDPAPNTTLPDPFTVSVVGGFSLDSTLVDTQSGDKTFKVVASWDAPTNSFVVSGGRFELEFKRSTESVWRSAGQVDGSLTEKEISQLEPDTLYDIRIFAFNSLGVRSQPSVIEDFLVGTTVTTESEDWENEDLLSEDWETASNQSQDYEND